MTSRMWGGRFEAAPSELLRALNDSFSFDRELFADDVQGSIAWAQALADAGVITAEECTTIVLGLRDVPSPGASRHPLPHAGEGTDDFEDVHSYVEAKLREKIGPLAGKLHTGRSRNDQVATDVKLWLRRACEECGGATIELARVLAHKALDEAATPMPGYTHSKRAEPVTFGHWALAYVEMLQRDLSRIDDTIARNNTCPLGSGALAGAPLKVNRESLAKSLGFARPTTNSIDAVSDRDFAVEYLFTASLLLSHLSRLAEDLIFFSSDEAGFVELPDALATGSSRMPQKKNPDVLELVRGHAARAIGELTGLLALLKGLPLGYDKDLQLDKEPLFRTRATLGVLLPALTALFAGLKLNRQRMRDAASDDMLLATAVADAIAAKGTPFRDAHELVSSHLDKLHDLAAEHGVTLESVLAKKIAIGGTSPQRVREAANVALKELSVDG
ncbi:MAG TPA: argininosuccinate lyase [Thermoanaerobaculia bacterium]